MTRERILIALFAFALLLGVLWVDWHFRTALASLVVIMALGGMAQAEVYPLLRRIGIDSNPVFGVSAAVILFALRGLGPVVGLAPDRIAVLLSVLLAAVVALPLLAAMFGEGARHRNGYEEFSRAAGTLFGLLLVWYLLSFLLDLRLLDDGSGTCRLGLKLTLLLVLSVKIGDSTAYLVGRSIGVTPLSWVSPRKTWEGALGSIGGAVGTTLLVGLPLGFKLWHLLLFGVATNVAGQLGDLMESFLKRRAGAKDSGAFLREMGGFLDLLDSLLLAAPAGYLFVRLVVL
jgi:phosphatidate cytidylyltransferase